MLIPLTIFVHSQQYCSEPSDFLSSCYQNQRNSIRDVIELIIYLSMEVKGQTENDVPTSEINAFERKLQSSQRRLHLLFRKTWVSDPASSTPPLSTKKTNANLTILPAIFATRSFLWWQRHLVLTSMVLCQAWTLSWFPHNPRKRGEKTSSVTLYQRRRFRPSSVKTFYAPSLSTATIESLAASIQRQGDDMTPSWL